jgi:hypothetical protein
MWRGDRVSIPPVVYSWVGGHFEGWQALLGWPAAAAAATTTRAGQQTRAPLGRNFFRRQREDPLSTLKKCRNPSSPRFLLPPVIINLSLPRWLTHPSLHGSHYTSQPPDMDSLLLLLMIRDLHSIGLFTKSLKLLLHLRIHSNYCTNPSSRPPLKSLRLFVFSAGFRTNPSLPTEISQFGSFCVQSLDLSSIYIPRSRPKHTHTQRKKFPSPSADKQISEV